MDRDSARELEWADAGEAVLIRELTRQQRRMEQQVAADPGGLFGDEIGDADRGFLEGQKPLRRFCGSFLSRQRTASSDGRRTRWRSLPRGALNRAALRSPS
jgi:hypothetical protein